MFEKIGNFVVKQRLWIILSWVVAALLMYFLAPSLSEVGTMNERNFLPQDSESLRARELIAQYFPQNKSTSTVTLVFYQPGKLGEADLAFARKVEEWLKSGTTPFKVDNVTSIFSSPELQTRLLSPDGTTMLMNIGLAEAAFESESLDTTRAIREHLKSPPPGLEIHVSGQVGVYSDLFDSLSQSIHLTTLITVILIIILLILIYRSPVAALVPLVTIGIAFLVARGIMGLIAQAGVPIWSQIDVFLVVLVFGVGTDYCLFLVSRFREEAGKRNSAGEAMRYSLGRIGTVITASAFAVIAGMAGMAVARYQMIQTMGPSLAVAILITLLAALTLAPALTSIFGRKLFWPRHEIKTQTPTLQNHSFWHRVASLTVNKSGLVVAVVLVVMFLPCLALPELNRSFDQMAEIPAKSDSVAGFKILEQHFDIGEMEPLTVIVKTSGSQTLLDPDSLGTLAAIGDKLLSIKGVVKVQSVVQPEGSGKVPRELTAAGQLSALSETMAESFSGQGNPGILPVGDLEKGLSQVGEYLNKLPADFAWVTSSENYLSSLADLKAIAESMAMLNSGLSPETQLPVIQTRVGSLINNLNALSAEFAGNGNPVYLPPTILQASPQLQNLVDLFFSKDRQATLLYVVLDAYPQSDTALNLVSLVRGAIADSVAENQEHWEVAVGGTSADLADVKQVLDADFNMVMLVVLAAIFLVLVILLRSLVAPIYLLMTVLLSYGTTLGLVTLMFQGLLGQEGVSFMIPIIVFVLLVALGSDYNIFLMSRVREESLVEGTRKGTLIAVVATGGVITACGIILAGTFGALVVTPIRTLLQIGVAVALGVLIDTFVVRALLVPSIARLIGRWNWWPGRGK
ncbi:MAG: efflux RND transporter permease subunit [Dehalococcoidales bacterium]|nr:efflux RND transporter permease subunit [Dehalococcoidales bacterium]